LGDLDWQQMKLRHSKMVSLFDEVVVEETDKLSSDFISDFEGAHEEIVLVNDKLREGLEMKSALLMHDNHCRLCLIDGPYTEQELASLDEKIDRGLMEGVERIKDIPALIKYLGLERETEVAREFKIR
jgi:hypothetical protein